jgi:hypothetical protein
VGHIQHTLGQLRPDTGQDVPHRESITALSDVGPDLLLHGVRAGSHLLRDPFSGTPVAFGSRHARPELNLGAGVLECRRPVERGLSAAAQAIHSVAGGEGGQECEGRDQRVHCAGHRLREAGYIDS